MKISNSLKFKLSAAVLGVLALGLGSTSVFAAATTTFQVSADVQATCLISATGMAFGTYTGAIANATSALSVTCTNTSGYSIGLSAGTTSGASDTARKMAGPGTDVLGYGLFSDSAHSKNWGQTVGTVSGTGNGSAQSITVYGQVPASQYVAPGAYTDTITATITY